MLKKIISYTIIFSIFYSDFAFCMLDSEFSDQNKGSSKRLTTEITSLFKPDSSKRTYSSCSTSTPSTPSPRSAEISDASPSHEGEKFGLLNVKRESDSSETKMSSEESKDFIIPTSPVKTDQGNYYNDLAVAEESESKKLVAENQQGLWSAEEDTEEEDCISNSLKNSSTVLLPQHGKKSVTADKEAVDQLKSDDEALLDRITPPLPSALTQLKNNENLSLSQTLPCINDNDLKDYSKLPTKDEADNKNVLSVKSRIFSLYKGLSSEDKHILEQISQEIIGNISCGQKALFLPGGFVGVGTSIAMIPLFSDNIFFLSTHYGDENLVKKVLGNIPLLIYIWTLSSSDTIPRNAMAWKKAIAEMLEKRTEQARIALTTFASLFPSLLEPLCMITAEIFWMKELDIEGFDNQFAITTAVLSPFLLADSWIDNYSLLWEVTDDYRDWRETSWYAAYLFGKSLNMTQLSPEAAIRKDFHKTLDKLSGHVFGLHQDDDYILKLYNRIDQFNSENLKAELPELENESIGAAHMLFLMHDLLSHGGKIKAVQKHISSIYESGTDIFNILCVAFGSPMRFMALQFGIETAFELFMSENAAWWWGVGLSALAFFPLTAFEYKGLQGFFRDFIQHENPHAHGSCFPARVIEKLGTALLGGTAFSLAFCILALQAGDKWFNNQPWVYALAAPFVFAEFAAQTKRYHGSCTRRVNTALISSYNSKREEGPCNDHKKDQVLQMIENIKGQIPKLPHSALHLLNQSLNMDEPEELEEL